WVSFPTTPDILSIFPLFPSEPFGGGGAAAGWERRRRRRRRRYVFGAAAALRATSGGAEPRAAASGEFPSPSFQAFPCSCIDRGASAAAIPRRLQSAATLSGGIGKTLRCVGRAAAASSGGISISGTASVRCRPQWKGGSPRDYMRLSCEDHKSSRFVEMVAWLSSRVLLPGLERVAAQRNLSNFYAIMDM
ncbi:unnamed protein product, partial [Urochloa humidicola]